MKKHPKKPAKTNTNSRQRVVAHESTAPRDGEKRTDVLPRYLVGSQWNPRNMR